jgi:hypothetical protein
MRLAHGWALCLAFLSGCSLLTPRLYTPTTEDIYKRDLKVRINGKEYVGVGVLPLMPEYKVEVSPEGKIDRIMWRTCNREEVVDRPESGWFSNKYAFTFKTIIGLEESTACGLSITVLEEKKRRNGFAMFEFEDRRPEVSLMATLSCNGVVSKHRGVSICQSAEGLYQQIEFPTPVFHTGASKNCDVMEPVNGNEKIYRFPLARGECSYYFGSQGKSANGKRTLHRLTTIGYTDVPPIKL